MIGRKEPGAALVTNVDSGCSVACVRSLGRRGVGTVVVANRDGTPAAASRFCDEAVTVPSPENDLLAYRDALLSLASRPDVRTIVPCRPVDSYVLSRYEDRFRDLVSLPVPPMSTLRTVHDRVELAAAAEEAGVPVPETHRLGAVDSWDADLLVKPRYNVLTDAYLDSASPRDAAVVKEIRHLSPGERPDTAGLRESMGHEPIVQEFVPKDGEYLFGGLYDHGEPLATFQHRQLRGDSYTGGGGVYRRSVKCPELETVARDLLSELEWHGLACIEYMRDARTGEFVLTEINPRMWQSLPVAVRAGADFPYHYWLQATGRAGEIDPDYEVGVGTHLLYGEFGHLLSVVGDDSPHVSTPPLSGTLWEVLSSCFADPSFDIFSIRDPQPFLRGVATFASRALTRRTSALVNGLAQRRAPLR